MSQGQWNKDLTPEQLSVMRDKSTEKPNSGAHLNNNLQGVYHCANCDQAIYNSSTKFNSGCGWPAFYREIPNSLNYNVDTSHKMVRTEICCSKCGGHMGHLFEGEGWKERLGLPQDTRHCVNSCSLNFKGE